MARPARILALALTLALAWPTAAARAGLEPRLGSLLGRLRSDQEASVIVVLAAQADLSPYQRASADGRGVSAGARLQHRRALVRELKQTAANSQESLNGRLRAAGARQIEPLWIINAVGFIAGRDLIESVAAWPGVEEVRLNGSLRVPATLVSRDPVAEWNLAAIGVPGLWDRGVTGQGVVIATLDSGADLLHADIGAKWRGGANSWFDPHGEHPDLPHDADGHGTAVMGVLVGGAAGGTAIGVAPGALWIAAKVFNDAGAAQDLRVHQGFQWLLDPDGDPDSDDAPDVVNASWGLADLSGACVPAFRADVQALRAAGIAVVVSAGNTGALAQTSVSPANYPESFAAGSVDRNLRVSSFSARGPSACDGTIFPEVVAPGEAIRTADLTLSGTFPTARTTVSGTSFAAPHTAGALALLISALPGRSVVALEAALRQTATDLAPTGADNNSGSGLIDVAAALAYLDLPEAAPLIAVLPSPTAFAFGAVPLNSTATAAFSVVNAGSADLLLGAISVGGTDATEFALSDDLCSGGELVPAGSCTFAVASSPLTPGRKTARLAIPSNDPSTPEVRVDLATNDLSAIGVWRNGTWYLDDGDGAWNAALDTVLRGFGAPGDVPVTGDWNGDGRTRIGVWRNGTWYLDDGDGAWNAALDTVLRGFGAPGDVPVTGDWNGDGRTRIGVWRNGTWYLDDGDGAWNAALDTVLRGFGAPGDIPVTGDWNGDGRTQIGVWRRGTWYLDDGDGAWNAALDAVLRSFGASDDVPLSGVWR